MAKFVFRKRENMGINKPMYFAIGLLMLLLIVGILYFIFLKYSPIMNFKYEGYAISGKEITENLLGSTDSNNNTTNSNADKNIELAKIEEQGTIFKKLNEYFVGNKEKTEINLNYPIYINNNSTIYNLAEDTTLISKDFEEISGYPNLSISEGKIYDGNSLERADGKEYIFVKTPDNIFVNLYEIKITTTANEYTIPVNSILAFTENEIRYYTVNNNVLVFNEIKDIDNNSNVEIVENSYIYEELLTRLGILEDENSTKSEQESQNNIIQEDSRDENNSTIKNDDKEVTDENTTTNETEQGQASYIKPQVTVEDFKAEVYTAKSMLHINDPTGRIIEAPTFEIYRDGKMYDLKEELTYPETFKDEEIKSIGNNLNTQEKEVEVTYNNGDKIKFNYQTGEIISEEKSDENKAGLIEYIQDKLETDKNEIIKNEEGYEHTKELVRKLEEIPVDKARDIQNETQQNEQIENQEITSTNYLITYNANSESYEIYNEEDLLNTTKQTIETENEKIEKNDLSSFYSAQVSRTSEKSGRNVIYIIIIAIVLGLIILIKYNINKNRKKHYK